jgi:hypothetical protein
MKNLFWMLCIVLSVSFLSMNNAHAAETKTKKVCNVVKDAKTKKSKEVCKTIKIHKKLEPSKKK